MFKTAHENGSIMWQDVISFHNPWLEKQGIYDEITKTLDEKVNGCNTLAMREMQKEGLEKALSGRQPFILIRIIFTFMWQLLNHIQRENVVKENQNIRCDEGKVVNNLLDRKQEQNKLMI